MSKSKLKSAQYSINECVKNIKGYSFASKADMRHMLNRCIKDLHEQGYKLGHLNGLKPKHIYILVDLWKDQGKSTATIKNYMAKLRKVGVLLDKAHLVKPGNDTYQINMIVSLPRYKFWDIQVPRIHSPTRQVCLRRPWTSWSPLILSPLRD